MTEEHLMDIEDATNLWLNMTFWGLKVFRKYDPKTHMITIDYDDGTDRKLLVEDIENTDNTVDIFLKVKHEYETRGWY